MRKLMLLFFVILSQAVSAQYASKIFNLVKNSSLKTLHVGNVYHDSAIIPLDYQHEISGLSISGRATLKTLDGFIRVTLTDDYNAEYLVYENYSIMSDSNVVEFDNTAMETMVLDMVRPVQLNVQIKNAELELDDIMYTTKRQSATKYNSRSNESRREQSQYIIEQLNAHLEGREKTWRAGLTSVTQKTYEEKKAMFGGKVPNLYGMEYYIGGIFVMPDKEIQLVGKPQSPKTSSPYVKEWDWRNRHGKNWITSVKDQGNCGSCWAFSAVGAVESYTNLYYNRIANMDLSEQELVSCDTILDHKCTGGHALSALYYIRDYGIMREEDFQYQADSVPCENKSTTPTEHLSINSVKILSDIIEDSIKKNLFHSPLSFAIPSMAHEMVLVGYKELQEGDTIYFGKDISNVLSAGNPYIGETAWIFKNSWGTEVNSNGFYIAVLNLSPSFSMCRPIGQVTCISYTNDSIICEDADGDGYYFWGVGPKPAHCPTWVPDTPDGDDSDYTKGPINEYGKLLNLPAYVSHVQYANETWEEKRYIYRHVIVSDGMTLTIKDDVVFYEGTQLTVQGGGQLIIDGGHLYNANIEICGQQNSAIKILNGGSIELAPQTDFSFPVGNTLQLDCGIIQ